MRILAAGQDDITGIAGKVSNGVEDGPHTDGVNEATEPTSKVVRLPRDWLGPHEELVPFGPRRAPSEPVPRLPEAPRSAPSAEDFWGGERSAAVHDVVEAPAYLGPHEPASATPTRPTPRFRLARRRLAAASIVIGAAVVAIVLLSAGPGHPGAGGARLNLAAILSGGVSRMWKIAPPRIVAATGVSRPHLRPVRHATHRSSARAPASHAVQHPSAPPPAPTYAVQATSAGAAPTYRSSVSEPSQRTGARPSPASQSPSSGGTVSATGESGALGPVQSPNG